jgi:hypothetical protein
MHYSRSLSLPLLGQGASAIRYSYVRTCSRIDMRVRKRVDVCYVVGYWLSITSRNNQSTDRPTGRFASESNRSIRWSVFRMRIS